MLRKKDKWLNESQKHLKQVFSFVQITGKYFGGLVKKSIVSMKLPSCWQCHIPKVNYSHHTVLPTFRPPNSFCRPRSRKIISEIALLPLKHIFSFNGGSQAGDVELLVMQEMRQKGKRNMFRQRRWDGIRKKMQFMKNLREKSEMKE